MSDTSAVSASWVCYKIENSMHLTDTYRLARCPTSRSHMPKKTYPPTCLSLLPCGILSFGSRMQLRAVRNKAWETVLQHVARILCEYADCPMSVHVRVLTPLNSFSSSSSSSSSSSNLLFFGNNLASSHWFQHQNLEHPHPC